MLIGFTSDAHGNPLGLRSCLTALRENGAEKFYFLGDAVGYLPGEAGVLAELTAVGVICQRGNHEGMLLGDLPLDPERDQAYGLAAARRRMTPAQLEQVASWPDVRELELADGGKRVLLVHGSPRDHLLEYVYPDSDLDWLGGLGYDAIFMGNTHRPFVARVASTLVVNVGSCGLPRDQGDLAACALYDPGDGTGTDSCEILRVRVPAAAVRAQYDGPVHPVVSECLTRETPAPVGRVVPIR